MNRTEPVSGTRTSYLIGQIDRMLRSELEHHLGGTGLTLNEVTTLSVLADRPGLSNAELARRALVSPQAMHKVMRSLETAGLVERAASPSGGRSLETRLTATGVERLAAADERIGRAEERFLASLDDEQSRSLRRLLVALVASGRETAAEAS